MGESIWRTLIELLEAQEQIKITYEIKEEEKKKDAENRIL